MNIDDMTSLGNPHFRFKQVGLEACDFIYFASRSTIYISTSILIQHFPPRLLLLQPPTMPSERVIRFTHTFLFTLVLLSSIVALGISASLVGHYNSHGYPPVHTDAYRDRIRILLVASVWTTAWGCKCFCCDCNHSCDRIHF